MPSAFAVKTCRPDQVGEVQALLKKTGVFYEPIDKVSVYAARLAHDPSSILVIEEDGVVIATAFLIYDPWVSFIFNLAVEPEYRRRGAGQALLQAAEAIARSRGTACLQAFVATSNAPSLGLFASRGYQSLVLDACETFKIFGTP